MKQKRRKKGSGGLPGFDKMRCPYCGSPVVLRSADGIYRENHDSTMLYVCTKYPACDAYVRVQPGIKNTPIGSMANGDLRALRREAHRSFDRIYETGLMSKQEAYAWLSGVLAAPMSHAHIGYLGEHYCRVVIDESKRFMVNNQERLKRIRFQSRSQPVQMSAVSGGG